jgi:phosphatidylinositol-3-phosphatase
MLRWLIPLAVACVAGALLLATNHRPLHVSIHPTNPLPPDPPGVLNHPCGHPGKPPAVYDHVIWIWMGDRGYGDVMSRHALGNYVKAYSKACGLATNYVSVTHPIVPNQTAALAGQTFGLTTNNQPLGGINAPNLFNRVSSWRVYTGGMRTTCQRTDSSLYRARNNPGLLFAGIPCRRNDVPLRRLPGDLKHNRLPRFSIIVPNACQSMSFDSHCPGRHTIPAFVAAGDLWLGHYLLPELTGSSTYRAGRTAIFVTWTEGTPPAPRGANCLARQAPNCHVVTLAIAPTVPPHKHSNAHFSHLALLKTTEELLGVRRPLGRSRTAPAMRAAFNL